MLYTQDDLNNDYITGELCRFSYKQVYFFQPSPLGDMRRETQFIKAYADTP